MWPLCTANNSLWLILPFLIGLLTGMWAWMRGSSAAAYDTGVSAPSVSAPPVAAPKVVAEPAASVGGTAAGVAAAGVAAAGVAAAAKPVVADPAPAPTPKPVAAAPKAAPAAAAALTAIGIPAAVGKADDLLQIKGIGPKLNDLLNSLGIQRFDQIAAWGKSEIGKVDAHLGSFKGRIDRDDWVEQAGLLAKGDIKAFEAKFGVLDSENKK